MRQDKTYVLDRFHLGELAYGPIYRKKSGLTELQQYYLELMLLKHNPLLIYCWLDYNELTWNFTKDREEFTQLTDIPRLDRLFRTAFLRSILPKQLYNYNKPSDFQLNDDVAVNTGGLSYIGHPRPTVLFVGDEPNYKRHENSRPHMVFNSTSSFFLLNVLKDLKLNFGVINSKEQDQYLTNQVVNSLKPTKIVCLGKNALRRYEQHCSLARKAVAVSHPQYAKRFYGKHAVNKYTHEIKEVIV